MFTRRRAKSTFDPLPQAPIPPTGNVTEVPPLLADAANAAAREEFEKVLPAASARVPKDDIEAWYAPPSERADRAS